MYDFHWEFPYPSVRMPVMAHNVVTTSQPLAAQAGLEMLKKGGNAVDSAVATAIALTVVEPTSNGVGSDAFAMIWDGERLHCLNASGKSPSAWSFEQFAGYESMPLLGWDTVTVPGAVSAWVELSERFGKLPFNELFAPAIHYARYGFQVSPITAKVWSRAPGKYRDFPEFSKLFLPGGKAPDPGETFTNPSLAKTLETIAMTKGEAFYQGELADRIVAHATESGGQITKEDLASHEARWIESISMDYHGITLHEIPPNGQGIAALIMLGILDNHGIHDYPVDSKDSLHLQIEAMKLALADTYRYVSDPSFMGMDCYDLLGKPYLSKRSTLIDMERAEEFDFGVPVQGQGDTVYLTTADESGMMVSFIQSNYMGFGSGIVIPDTGIAMQNRGSGFNLARGHPNQVDGGKLPFHTIIPAFVTQDGNPLMSFGVMGGPMQPQGHAQLIIRMFDYLQNPQSAMDAPRWQVFPNNEIAFEPGFDTTVLKELEKRGHMITLDRETLWFGGAQAIVKMKDGYCGASDPRKDGQAVGF